VTLDQIGLNPLQLKLQVVGSFKLEWKIVKRLYKPFYPYFEQINCCWIVGGGPVDVEMGPNGWFSENCLHTKVLKEGARMGYGNPTRWDFNILQNAMTRFV
jgi:hypothetical protein